MMENKQRICNKMCEAIRATAAGSTGNPLVSLSYLKLDNGEEVVRPLFADGTGSNGYYDINVSCDSGIAMIKDITKQFVRRMW